MPITLHWPTPIYHSDFDGDVSEIQQINREVENQLTQEEYYQPWVMCNMKSSFNYTKQNNFLNKTPTLENYIKKHIKNYINREDFQIYSSWINHSTKGSSQEPHSHLGDYYSPLISGCYYHETNGDDGDICFKSHSLLNTLPFTQIYCEEVKFKPEIGRLVLFPSYLQHWVTKNQTDGDRYSIAFNVTLDYYNLKEKND